MNKMFKLIMESGEHVYKHYGIYKNEKEARQYVEGNGEVIQVKEVTEDFPLDIDKLSRSLKQCGYGDIERNAIVSFIQSNYENSI